MVKSQECDHFLGIDFGSFETKIVISRVQSWKAQILEILKAFSCNTQGMLERGSIVDSDKLVEVLNEAFTQHLLSFSDKYIFASFSTKNRFIESKINKVVNPFSRRRRELNISDLTTAQYMAYNAPIEDGREYIDFILRGYTVDGTPVPKNPQGIEGTSLEAEHLLISTSLEEIEKYKLCSEKIHLNLDSLAVSSLAASTCLLAEEEKEHGVLLFDIGSQTVSAAWFEQGSPKSVIVVPSGIDDISKDIQDALNISIGLSRQILHDFSCVDDMYLRELEAFEEVQTEDGVMKHIDTKLIYQISFARMIKIFKLAYMLLGVRDNLAYPVVITGGGARLRGITSFIEKQIGTKSRLAHPSNWGGPINTYRSPNYGVAIGLCVSGFQCYNQNKIDRIDHLAISGKKVSKQSNTKKWIGKFSKSIKNFFSLGSD